MARQTPFIVGLSALLYLVLLFSPLAFVQTANAQDQESLQQDYGTGEWKFEATMWQRYPWLTRTQSSVSIWEPPTLVSV